MGASSALLVFSHTLPVNFIVQLGGKPRHIQADLAREAVQMVPGQMTSWSQQQVMHLPEPALSARGFCRLGRHQCQWMGFLQWKMTEDESHVGGVQSPKLLDRRFHRLADGALEIAVFDHDNRSACGATTMIRRGNRCNHDNSSIRRSADCKDTASIHFSSR